MFDARMDRSPAVTSLTEVHRGLSTVEGPGTLRGCVTRWMAGVDGTKMDKAYPRRQNDPRLDMYPKLPNCTQVRIRIAQISKPWAHFPLSFQLYNYDQFVSACFANICPPGSEGSIE